MRAKRKQDTATMTPAEREALEVADLRAQIGPLFDLYMACIQLITEGLDTLPDNLHNPLHMALLARNNLKLCGKEERRALKVLQGGGRD